MAVNVKLGVDIGGFKRGISEAQNSLKTLDAALKNNEASFKAGGDAQIYMKQKTELLNAQMRQQRQIADQARAALQTMAQNGVSKTSAAYQQMQRNLLNAQTAMLSTQQSIDGLDESQLKAADIADKLSDGLNGISQKISLEQVISGIDRITSGLENAAKKAVKLGETIWDNVVDSAKWADDTATQASILGMSVEDFQKLQTVFDTVGDITVQEWTKAKRKVQNAIYSPTSEQTDILQALGISTGGTAGGKYGEVQTLARGWEDIFWDVSEELRKRVAAGTLSQDNADTMAQALFGMNASKLNPLMDLGREGFKQAFESANAASEDSVKNLAELNDQLVKLEADFNILKTEVLAQLAPALREGAEALDGLLGRLIEYSQSPEGQEMLSKLGESVSKLFEDLGKIDPETVVQNFTTVFNTVVEGMQWLVNNKDGVIAALEGIVIGWGALKLTGGALQIYRLISGLQGLGGGVIDKLLGGGAEAGAAATGAAGSGLVARASAFLGGKLGGLLGAAGNGVPVLDWFMNETFLGQNLRNTGDIAESIGATFEKLKGDITENFRTFAEDWKGVAEEVFTDPNRQASEQGKVFKNALDELQTLFEGADPVPVKTEPEVPEDAAAQIAAQVGTVRIGARIVPISLGGGPGGSGLGVTAMLHANGLAYVPFDNYPALLHRGERVVPARENRSYTYNTYFGNVNLNNGLEVEALAESIERRNKRQRNGYGS